MASNGNGECRHQTSYSELDGIQVKISEKYRFSETSFMQQVGMACLTLKDLSELDKYEYNFQTELMVLRNFNTDNMKSRSSQ